MNVGDESAVGDHDPLPAGALVLDVGASLGLYGLAAAAACGGGCTVYAVEPSPVTFRYLV